MSAPARVYLRLSRRGEALAYGGKGGLGLLLREYNRFQANDLTGSQRVFGAGLYAGIDAGFCGPSWPDLGPCWGFAAGLQCWAGRERSCDAYFHCMNAQPVSNPSKRSAADC